MKREISSQESKKYVYKELHLILILNRLYSAVFFVGFLFGFFFPPHLSSIENSSQMKRLIFRIGGGVFTYLFIYYHGEGGLCLFLFAFFCLPVPVFKGFDYQLAKPYLYITFFSPPSLMELSAVEAVQYAKAEFWKICQGLLCADFPLWIFFFITQPFVSF